MKIVTRQEAIDNKLTRYFTGEPCKHSHISEKLLSNRTCVECLLIKKRIRGARPDVKAKDLARLNAADTPAKHLARTRKRQAKLIQRTPSWDPCAHLIPAKYQLAAMLSRETGEDWQVDHHFPLNGKLVSGLHVFANLVVKTKTENLKKSNKMPV